MLHIHFALQSKYGALLGDTSCECEPNSKVISIMELWSALHNQSTFKVKLPRNPPLFHVSNEHLSDGLSCLEIELVANIINPEAKMGFLGRSYWSGELLAECSFCQ